MYSHCILEPDELRQKHVVEMSVSNWNCMQIMSILWFSFSFPSSDCRCSIAGGGAWSGRGEAGWTGFQCWTTNISHQPPCAENPRTELCTLLSARHKLGGDSWTVGTAPPTRRTSSFSVTTLETWRSADAPHPHPLYPKNWNSVRGEPGIDPNRK